MTVTSATKGNGKIAGLVIGLSLTLIILVGLNITGLSVNPARSFAIDRWCRPSQQSFGS